MTRRRVAILGGGVAGLTAAYELTSPDQPNPPEVTIYQLGWRLGGKCASGRDQSAGGRVQEHGLHVFFGFYDNAFAMLRDCYQQLDLSKERFRTIWEALAPYDQITVMEAIDGKQVPWVIDCPVLSGQPGDPNPPTLWSIMLDALKWLLKNHASLVDGLHGRPRRAGLLGDARAALSRALDTVRLLGETIENHTAHDHYSLAELVRTAAKDLKARLDAGATLDDKLRRLLTLFDFAATNVIGALADGVLRDPYSAARRLNAMEYRDWLNRHSILHLAEKSAVLRALYDLIFAYPGGDVNQPGDVAAGAMLLGLFQLGQYRGSVLYKMRAGTGDIVAAPLYKLLRQRGVKFEFFHRVDELTPAADGQTIAAIRIGRQVTLKSGSYDPFIRCQDLDCWPAEPLYDQIVQGEQLKRQQIDLESPWSGWADAGGSLTLQQGKDFDDVVLAISVAALPPICAKLAASNSRWQGMLDQVGTVETMSVQLWFNPSVGEMGWQGEPGALLGGYDVSQLDTWADISEVLPSEDWGDKPPGNASILVGPMKGPSTPPPPSERDYPAQAQKAVVAEAQAYLEGASSALWPALNQRGFEWSALHGPPGLAGPQRLMTQYMRANIAPSERYVLSRAGTIAARIRADASGYKNLALAGDWTENPQNLGSFEATVMSGKLASRALTGFPKQLLRVAKDSPLMQPPPDWPPAFADQVGQQTFPGRIDFAGARLTSYFLKADRARLADLCRNIFDTPSGGALSVVPLSEWIMVSFADMGRGSFASRPDLGWSTEKELAFWMWVGVLKEPGSDELVGAYLYNPYLFLDNPVALLTGREVFGFHKQMGWVTLPPPGADELSFKVDAFGTTTGGANAQWQQLPLLSLSGSKPITSIGEALTDLASVIAHLGELMPDIRLRPGLPLLEEFARCLVHGWAPLTFLKQFRDVENPNLACYQAICTSDMQLNALHGVRLLEPGTLSVSPVANLPICDHLGIAASGQTGYGVELVADMTLYPGRELWRAERKA